MAHRNVKANKDIGTLLMLFVILLLGWAGALFRVPYLVLFGISVLVGFVAPFLLGWLAFVPRFASGLLTRG